MPRYSRQKSGSGVYHVILRGINHQLIFEDEEDNVKFIRTLKTYKKLCKYAIYAYCLMGNHIHLLIKVDEDDSDKNDIGAVIKRIACSYAYWYNLKYNRSGHLFQDRFKSEVVENDYYFRTVLRYIHANPVKAGLCDSIDKYHHSSFMAYNNGDSSLVDISFALSLMGIKEFIEFHSENCNYEGIDSFSSKNRMSDFNAKNMITELLGCISVTEIQSYERIRRNKALKVLRENGLSIRQLNRLTGVSKGVICKVMQ